MKIHIRIIHLRYERALRLLITLKFERKTSSTFKVPWNSAHAGRPGVFITLKNTFRKMKTCTKKQKYWFKLKYLVQTPVIALSKWNPENNPNTTFKDATESLNSNSWDTHKHTLLIRKSLADSACSWTGAVFWYTVVSADFLTNPSVSANGGGCRWIGSGSGQPLSCSAAPPSPCLGAPCPAAWGTPPPAGWWDPLLGLVPCRR